MVRLNQATVALLAGALVSANNEIPDFRYLGGLGPYISLDGMGVDPNTPMGCKVDQVITMCRHGERYPQTHEYDNFTKTLKKIQSSGELSGPLEFLSNYTLFMTENQTEIETSTGPYNGHYEAIQLGKQYRAKYGHLWNENKKMNFFTTDQDRVHDTANHFMEGFFGKNWTDKTNTVILPELSDDPVNSLTPENACDDKYTNIHGGYPDEYYVALENEFPKIAERLNQYTGADLNYTDAYNLMNLCPYEINTIGKSKFCAIFTDDEWKTYDYVTGLYIYYGWGAGQKNLSAAAGSIYANATMEVLKEGPCSTGPLYFNFAHDSDITQVLAALNLLVPKDDIPLDHRDDKNVFKISQIVPMLAHLTMERVTCGANAYVRLNLNDAYIPIEGCDTGPGRSCPIDSYEDYVHNHYTSYEKYCGIEPGKSKYAKFFWQHKNN